MKFFQFSLRDLLIVMVLFCIIASMVPRAICQVKLIFNTYTPEDYQEYKRLCDVHLPWSK